MNGIFSHFTPTRTYVLEQTLMITPRTLPSIGFGSAVIKPTMLNTTSVEMSFSDNTANRQPGFIYVAPKSAQPYINPFFPIAYSEQLKNLEDEIRARIQRFGRPTEAMAHRWITQARTLLIEALSPSPQNQDSKRLQEWTVQVHDAQSSMETLHHLIKTLLPKPEITLHNKPLESKIHHDALFLLTHDPNLLGHCYKLGDDWVLSFHTVPETPEDNYQARFEITA